MYLKGIQRFELEKVIDFLYNGETNVAQEELNNFLETAQELQVKGLQNNSDDAEVESKFQNNSDDLTNCVTPESEIEHKDITNNTLDSIEELTEVSVVETKEEPSMNTNMELDLQIEQIVERNEGLWNCKVCGKTSKKKTHIKQHAETHIAGRVNNCHICNKPSSTRASLNFHISNYHSGLSFTCNYCSKSWVTRDAFNKHNRFVHKAEKCV